MASSSSQEKQGQPSALSSNNSSNKTEGKATRSSAESSSPHQEAKVTRSSVNQNGNNNAKPNAACQSATRSSATSSPTDPGKVTRSGANSATEPQKVTRSVANGTTEPMKVTRSVANGTTEPQKVTRSVANGTNGATANKTANSQGQQQSSAAPKSQSQKQSQQKSKNGGGGADHSVLKPSIKVSLSGMRQALSAMENGPLEVRGYLLNECNLIYECKVCFNMFRSLANLIAHKRSYCSHKHKDVRHFQMRDDPSQGNSTFEEIHSNQESLAFTTAFIQPEDPVETVVPEKNWDLGQFSPSLELLKDAGLISELENRPAVSRLLPKQSLDSVINRLKDKAYGSPQLAYFAQKKEAAMQNLVLEGIKRTDKAVFQSLPGQNATAGSRYVALERAKQQQTVFLGPDGKIIEPGPVSNSLSQQLGMHSPGGSSDSAKENQAQNEISIEKFSCPLCKKEFDRLQFVYRHFIRFHKKTKEAAIKLRKKAKILAIQKAMKSNMRPTPSMQNQNNKLTNHHFQHSQHKSGGQNILSSASSSTSAVQSSTNLLIGNSGYRCRYCAKFIANSQGLGVHEKHCAIKPRTSLPAITSTLDSKDPKGSRDPSSASTKDSGKQETFSCKGCTKLFPCSRSRTVHENHCVAKNGLRVVEKPAKDTNTKEHAVKEPAKDPKDEKPKVDQQAERMKRYLARTEDTVSKESATAKDSVKKDTKESATTKDSVKKDTKESATTKDPVKKDTKEPAKDSKDEKPKVDQQAERMKRYLARVSGPNEAKKPKLEESVAKDSTQKETVKEPSEKDKPKEIKDVNNQEKKGQQKVNESSTKINLEELKKALTSTRTSRNSLSSATITPPKTVNREESSPRPPKTVNREESSPRPPAPKTVKQDETSTPSTRKGSVTPPKCEPKPVKPSQFYSSVGGSTRSTRSLSPVNGKIHQVSNDGKNQAVNKKIPPNLSRAISSEKLTKTDDASLSSGSLVPKPRRELRQRNTSEKC